MQFGLRTLLLLTTGSALLLWLALCDNRIGLPLLALGAVPLSAAIVASLVAGHGEQRNFTLGAASMAWFPPMCVAGSLLLLVLIIEEGPSQPPGFWQRLDEAFASEDQEQMLLIAGLHGLLVGSYLLTWTAGVVAAVLGQAFSAGNGSPRRPRLLAAILIGGYLATTLILCTLVQAGAMEGALICLWGSCLLSYPIAVTLAVRGRGRWRAAGLGLAVATYTTLPGNILLLLLTAFAFVGEPDAIDWQWTALCILGVKWLAMGLSVCSAVAAWSWTTVRSSESAGLRDTTSESSPQSHPASETAAIPSPAHTRIDRGHASGEQSLAVEGRPLAPKDV